MTNLEQKIPFGDTNLSDQERIDWLLQELTIDEKLNLISSYMGDIPRLGIKGMSLGGEAAHGIEARNDQNGIGTPDITTSFPQPIGMSASWDREAIRRAGEVTGIEGRVVYHRHPQGGLSRWAPTVDLERDPRWGRNEEGYGEDPVINGEMSSAYIQGMQGDDPYFIRVASTLKHFYANNVEEGRHWKNSSISPRNMHESYIEPFRRAIQKGRAEGVMTAYNKINGIPGVLNHQVKDLLKKEYGLTHAVSDGGAMELAVKLHHYAGIYGEALAGALKAGVDTMSDHRVSVNEAAHDAFELGLITEEDLDRSIANTMRTRLRLGIYDNEPRNPYDLVSEADLNCDAHQEICRNLSRESVVLLQNEQALLPLSIDDIDSVAVVGPFADLWLQDWYGGEPHHKTTLVKGLQMIGAKQDMAWDTGADLVKIMCGEKGLAVDENERVYVSDTPDLFWREDWGEGSYTYRCQRTGKLLNIRMEHGQDDSCKFASLWADRQEAFSWFVTELFHEYRQPEKGGKYAISGRFDGHLYADEDGTVWCSHFKEAARISSERQFLVVLVEDGLDRIRRVIQNKKYVIMALGSHAMINAKECVDRKDLELPPRQQAILELVSGENENAIMALFSNYIYTFKGYENKVKAILWSATGSQDMGLAMAECLFGLYAPAGRTTMTWYPSVDVLPSIDEYDLIEAERTYRYYDKDVLFPFGHGLTYSPMEYSNLEVQVVDDSRLKVSVQVQNTGKVVSDEVVQIYMTAPLTRVKRPLIQLLDFDRIKQLAPAEKRTVSFEIPLEEMRYYDVLREDFLLEGGQYKIYAGRSSKDLQVSTRIYVLGEQPGVRNLASKCKADHFDTHENVELVEGQFGLTAITKRKGTSQARVIYKDCKVPEDAKAIFLHMKSPACSRIEVYLEDQLLGTFDMGTTAYDPYPVDVLDCRTQAEELLRAKVKPCIYEDVKFELPQMICNRQTKGAERTLQITLVIKGEDVRVTYLYAK